MRSLCSLALGLLIAGTAAAAPSVAVRTAVATQRTLSRTLNVYGRVDADPRHVRALDVLHAARVERLQVSLGQRVRRGQTLMVLTTAPQARRAWQQARSALASASARLDQVRDLASQQLATKADLAAARQSRDDARTTLATLENEGADRARTVLKAPQDAVVTALPVRPGALVQAGQTLLSLGSRRHLRVVLGIEPEDAPRVRAGMRVHMHAVFDDGAAPIDARLAAVHAAIDPSTHLIDAVVHLHGKAAMTLVPGTWMRARIVLDSGKHLAVPRAAVLDDAHGPYVFVVRGGHAHRVSVRTGFDAGDWIAVSGKLSAGDSVVVAGNYELHDGMAVRSNGTTH